jgi:hypothetical protein
MQSNPRHTTQNVNVIEEYEQKSEDITWGLHPLHNAGK